MNEVSRNRRRVTLRVGTLFALMAALAVGVFWLGRVGSDAGELNPNDSMTTWRTANLKQKQAMAEILVTGMQRNGKLGRQTQAALEGSKGIRTLVDELVAALDAATDRNRSEYVSPGDRIALTAATAAAKMGWNQ